VTLLRYKIGEKSEKRGPSDSLVAEGGGKKMRISKKKTQLGWGRDIHLIKKGGQKAILRGKEI